MRGRRPVLVLLAFVLGVLILWSSAVFFIPLPPDLAQPDVGPITLLDYRGRELGQIASLQARTQQTVSLDQMGSWLPRVTVALEDRRFPLHRGVDWTTLGGSLLRNLRNGRIISGGSTITQQVIKLASTRTDRTFLRKLYEFFAAQRLERTWTKNQILTEYLNRLHYGNRLVGPQAAAQAYFHKNVTALTPTEAIFLAGLPQAPSRYNPWSRPEGAVKRYQRSLQRLADLALITPDQAERWKTTPPAVGRYFPTRNAPHFVDAVMLTHPLLRGSVTTTLNLDLQHRAEGLVAAQAQALQPWLARQLAVVIIENQSGAVRALVGSPDYNAPQGQINGALIYRSAGSTLKPFLYLHAIDTRTVTAATLLPDTEEAMRAAYRDYDPENYSQRYLGPVRVREALACSLNVPAVLTVEKLGARTAFAELEKWNIRTRRSFHDYGAGFILGNAEVRLLDLTAAYAGLARGGLAQSSHLLVGQPGLPTRVATSEAVMIINDILCDPHARQRTFGLDSPLQTGARFPVKTGTSSGFRDAWCIGFTREHTVGVWVGNVDGQPMKEIAAVRAAAPLWRALIDQLRTTDHEIPPPQLSDTLIALQVCSLSGLLPEPPPVTRHPSLITEYFLPGTAPTTDASAFFATVNGREQILLPGEYAAWCASRWNDRGALVQPNTPLEILSPSRDAILILSPHLPREQQMIELKSNQDQRTALQWTVDGQPVSTQQGRYFWPLETGSHEVVVTAGSREARTRFTVKIP